MELKWQNFTPFALAALRSNRTFMELKYQNYLDIAKAQASSNRTFMELKLLRVRLLVLSSSVLIVPLWN